MVFIWTTYEHAHIINIVQGKFTWNIWDLGNLIYISYEIHWTTKHVFLWISYEVRTCSLFDMKLTYWCGVTRICVSKLTIIGWRHDFIWTYAGILLFHDLGTNFTEIFSKIQTVSSQKMHLNMSSAKWCIFRSGRNVLTELSGEVHINFIWNSYDILGTWIWYKVHSYFIWVSYNIRVRFIWNWYELVWSSSELTNFWWNWHEIFGANSYEFHINIVFISYELLIKLMWNSGDSFHAFQK